MVAKKEDKEKVSVVNFKDKSSHWWVNSKHYCLTEHNDILFIAGGIEITAETDFLRDFILRNKKTFKEREISPYINSKEYNEILLSGKYQTKTVGEVKDIDRKYLIWMRDNYSYSPAQEKLKQQIINILK